MENVVNIILPRICGTPCTHSWNTHPYMGKTNLLRQLPKLLRAYSKWIAHKYGQDYRIIIIIDKDHDDCIALKQTILGWSQAAGISNNTTVRIATVMLEAWFLGDSDALEKAFPRLRASRIGTKAMYRDPDRRSRPSQDMDTELKAVGYKTGYQKLSHSTLLSPYLNLGEGENRSRSFQVTLATFQNLLSE